MGVVHFQTFVAIWLASVAACSGSLLSTVTGAVQSTANVVNNTNSVSQANDANGCFASLGLSLTPSPDANLTTPQLITKYGYPVETHNVTTADGYILTLFRIPRGKSATTLPYAKRPVAFLQHGLLCSSSDWLMNDEDKSLAYILANAGYDVWLGNARGTDYSPGHVNLTQSELAYWNFSWHEMGEFDIPAVIDYILEETGEPKIYYVGHSMGTTMFWVMASLFPEYNDKIRSMVALAPVAYLANMLSPLALLAPAQAAEAPVFDVATGGQFLPQSVLNGIHSVGPVLCGPSPLALAVCGSAFFVIAGIDPCQFNSTEQISNIVGHTPNTVSSKTVFHYLQLKNSRKFEEYDYGLVGNMEKYGQNTPPKYNLSKITTKVAAYWGQNDILSVPIDVATLIPQLANVIKYTRVDFDLWNHLDFTYGMDVNELIYDDVLKVMAANY